VESLFAASLHISDFVQTQNEAKILTTRISNCESAQEAWQILETTYEGTKLVKSAKLQKLISRFEEIKMLEDETFNEFYTRISDEWQILYFWTP
jgi:hypothetical protein